MLIRYSHYKETNLPLSISNAGITDLSKDWVIDATVWREKEGLLRPVLSQQ